MVRRTITYPETTPQTLPAPERQRSELAAKLQAAFVLAAILGSGAAVAVTLFCLLLLKFRPAHIVGALTLGTVVLGATFGWHAYKWTLQVATRDWGIEDKALARQYAREDEEHAAQLAALDAPREQDADENEILEELDRVVKAILIRHYDGRKITRDECTAAGTCSQQQWNLASNAFALLGWRHGRKLDPGPSFVEAWENWQQLTRADSGHIWAIRPGGQWRKVE